jgi:DNA-3-methyladenine glycosylase
MASRLNVLSSDFFLNPNVQQVAKELLGKTLFTNINGTISSAIITETEAYQGPEDRASHAYNNKRTQRTEVMYAKGGCCYIYLCYGIHYLFNIVTNHANIPHAVLIRSAIIKSGLSAIQSRRNDNISDTQLLHGPGNFAKGMGITIDFNGLYLNSKNIWIENTSSNGLSIESAPRVGIDFAGPDALLPWRYILKQ